MKRLLFLLALSGIIAAQSCVKENEFGGVEDKEAMEYKFPCDIGECDTCDDMAFVDPNAEYGHDYHRIVVKPMIFDEECGCYISGLVKITDCGETVAIISYGNGECDAKGLKTTCVDGDCEGDKAYTCEFDLDCEIN